MKSVKVALALTLGMSSVYAQDDQDQLQDQQVQQQVQVEQEVADVKQEEEKLKKAEQDNGDQVEDVVDGVIFLKKKIVAGAKHAGKAVAVGTIFVSVNVVNGLAKVYDIEVEGLAHITDTVILPVYEKVIRDTLYEAGLKNGLYKLVLKPIGSSARHGANRGGEIVERMLKDQDADPVFAKIVKVSGQGIGGAVGASVGVYEVVLKQLVYDKGLKPAGQAIGKAAKATKNGVWKVLRAYGKTFKNKPGKSGKEQQQQQTQQN